MTQPAPTDTAVETGTLDAGTQGDNALMPDNASSSIAPELLATLPTPAPTTDDDGSDDDTAPLDEADEAPTEEGDEAAPDEVNQWLAQIADNPRSITSVPRARLPEVVDRIVEIASAATENAYQQGLQHGEQRARTTATLQEKVAELDQYLEDGDMAAFKEAVKTFPNGEKNYYRVKAELTPIPEGSPQQFQQRAEELFRQLSPEAQQVLQQSWNYSATEQDMLRLARDVGILQERTRGATTAASPHPIQQRREAQKQRKETPKPDVSQGVAAGGELSPAEVRDMSPEKMAMYLSTPEGKAKVDRAMAKIGA